MALTQTEFRDVGDEMEELRGKAAEALLCEVAWEVCQQVGGIYTVIRSKAPTMTKLWGKRYCVVGPYNSATSPAEFEEHSLTGPFGQAVRSMQEKGMEVHYGHWLITGRPRAVLVNPQSVMHRLGEIKYLIWEHHKISLDNVDDLTNQVLAFGFMVEEFFRNLVRQQTDLSVVGHFHEWMGATALPEIRYSRIPMATVFTTHATQLGRYLAQVDSNMYDHLPFVNVDADARRFNIEAKTRLERAAAHGSHVFTTVSDVTALECEHLLKRKVDVVLPNGLNIQRFVAMHEFQNLHRIYKEKINEFVIGHFFPSYSFNLDQTIYFFTSGRYEYTNKGFDLTIEALARLNYRLKQVGTTKTIVFFMVSKQPFRSINPDVLRSRALMEEMRKSCQSVKEQVGERLFHATAVGRWPRLDELVDEYWRLRIRRTMHAWKASRLPSIVTHDLWDDHTNEVLNNLRRCNLVNHKEDPVKFVYHPDFITSNDPLFGMDYDHFVRGCHLGVFPSQYEPWGYSPLECIALGNPAVTSDLTGFGAYVEANVPEHDESGVMVVPRRHTSYDEAANRMADMMFRFVQMDRRERITLRNRVESISSHFDWGNLGRHYVEAHELALERM